jgi:hypothetical protein
MKPSDIFNNKDLVRTALLGSAFLFFIGTFYGFYLHSDYSGQIDRLKLGMEWLSDSTDVNSSFVMYCRADLKNVEAGAQLPTRCSLRVLNVIDGLDEYPCIDICPGDRIVPGSVIVAPCALAESAATSQNFLIMDSCRRFGSYGDADFEARLLSWWSSYAHRNATILRGPSITPTVYMYFSYWVASAAYTQSDVNLEYLGLSPRSQRVMRCLEGGCGTLSWYSLWSKYLGGKPELNVHFWTFYIFVLLVSFFVVLLATKEKYEVAVAPYVIYGALSPMIFWFIFSAVGLISAVVGFPLPRESQTVSLMGYPIILIILVVLSAFGGLAAGLLKYVIKRRKEKK